jgi:membrane protease YdiL (CAAX protease family)
MSLASPNVSAPASALLVLVKAIVSGGLVFLIAQGVWIVLLTRMIARPEPFPWELPAMAGFLAIGCVWLKWGTWPQWGRAFRREGVRLNPATLRAILLALTSVWPAMIAGFCLYAAHRAQSGMGGEQPITLPLVPHGPALFAGLVMPGVVAGVVEEIAFRGFTQGTLEKRFGLLPAILISGFCWGLVHTNHGYFGEEALLWIGMFLVIAAMLGIIANRTNSVIPGILVHAGFDTTYFVAAGILQPRIAPLAFILAHASPPQLLAAAMIASVCSVAGWLGFFRATRA